MTFSFELNFLTGSRDGKKEPSATFSMKAQFTAGVTKVSTEVRNAIRGATGGGTGEGTGEVHRAQFTTGVTKVSTEVRNATRGATGEVQAGEVQRCTGGGTGGKKQGGTGGVHTAQFTAGVTKVNAEVRNAIRGATGGGTGEVHRGTQRAVAGVARLVHRYVTPPGEVQGRVGPERYREVHGAGKRKVQRGTHRAVQHRLDQH